MGKYTYLCLVFLKKGCLYSLIWIDMARIDMKTATKALVSESALCADCGCLGIGKRIGGGHVLPTRRSRNSFRLSFLLRRNENNGIMARIKQPKEEWREIPGYEGLYKVSSYGRIIAQPRTIVCKCKDGSEVTRYYQWRYVEPKPDKRNYRYVSLRDKDGNVTKISIHRLIATVFIPNPDNLPIVNHKDENPGNNRADNLEWCTSEYNLNYGTAQSRRIATFKANEPARALVRAEAKAAERIKEKGLIVVDKSCGPTVGKFRTIEEAKQKLGIMVKSNRLIKECLDGEEYSAYGYCWFYEKDLEFNP